MLGSLCCTIVPSLSSSDLDKSTPGRLSGFQVFSLGNGIISVGSGSGVPLTLHCTGCTVPTLGMAANILWEAAVNLAHCTHHCTDNLAQLSSKQNRDAGTTTNPVL